jgi:peptidoglycan hydrolase-like protein with peptidoglycan-binding domain
MSRQSRRGRGTAIVAAVLVVAAVVVVVVVVASRSDSSDAASAPKQLSTVGVVRKDLITYDETTATLGYTTSVTVSSPVAGTVTSVAAVGDTIDAGTVMATIDGSPVVAMFGDIPGYRDLEKGVTDGVDVRELEQNLVQLGFDPDGDITIDEHYDAATAAAVTRWEASIGLTGDGEVPRGQIVYVPGKLLVDGVSIGVGGATGAGSALLTGRQTERQLLVSSRIDSATTIGKFAAPGTAVTTGTVLFWQGGSPVVAIEGDEAALPALTRDLKVGVADGADVKLLERMLSAGGFDPGKAMTVDDHFDAATADAVVRWHQSLGISGDTAAVTVPTGSFAVVPAGLFVGTPLVADGTSMAHDAVVLSLTTAAREVTTTAPVGDTTFAKGATIDVEFPDASIQPGTVVSVGNVATNTSNNPGATPSVSITLHVDEIPAAYDSFVQIPVTLRAVADQQKSALVVPVGALVALAEGGYAVEVVDAKGPPAVTHLVAVKPGLFSDGFVAVTADRLSAGQQVVVPS